MERYLKYLFTIAPIVCRKFRPPHKMDFNTSVDVRGMTILDRSKFSTNLVLPVIKVEEEFLSACMKVIKPLLFKICKFKPVQPVEPLTSNGHICTSDHRKGLKYVYLNPLKVKSWQDLSESVRIVLIQNDVPEARFSFRNIELTYENWSSDQIFKAVLPVDQEILSSYSIIGHIVHLNLRDHLLDYKYLIGEVLLDKVVNCKTIVNKVNIIDNTYRNFSMELLAGVKDFQVSVKENKCTFEFDFSHVYWNPRLGKEHERIVLSIKEGDILFDVFAGVGPFSVPIAKKKSIVYCNDLNPESFKWLNHNAKLNKVKMENFHSYNMDGRNFINEVFFNFLKDLYLGNTTLKEGVQIIITMNLPALAVTFLDSFKGLLEKIDKKRQIKLNILVHVYCFAADDNPANVAKDMVEENLGYKFQDELVDIFHVRNVSPKKEMMKVSFNLSETILLSAKQVTSKRTATEDYLLNPKKPCTPDS